MAIRDEKNGFSADSLAELAGELSRQLQKAREENEELRKRQGDMPQVQFKDWTCKHGMANSSEKYLEIAEAIEKVILNGAHDLLRGRSHVVARVILSHLAHKYEMAPKK